MRLAEIVTPYPRRDRDGGSFETSARLGWQSGDTCAPSSEDSACPIGELNQELSGAFRDERPLANEHVEDNAHIDGEAQVVLRQIICLGLTEHRSNALGHEGDLETVDHGWTRGWIKKRKYQ